MYKKSFSCKNKTAIVTGGAGLIGREIVKALYEFGAKVYIADVNEEHAEKITKDSEIKFCYLDVNLEDSTESGLKNIIRDTGRLDILVNCAYPRTKDWGEKFEKVPFESLKKNIDSQFGGCFLCSRVAAEQMKEQGGGSIVNLASTYGMVAPDFSIYEGTEITMPVAYSAIKGGVITFTKYLATYYAKHKVRANSISPGGIFDNQPKPFVKKYSKKTPLGRMGKPGEIACAAIFLASEASSYVTGHNLVVDGGWTAW
tara:strand:+ start:13187 stop:13957 length:771 start_codon:yes stop_codon:yes gene_type:complete